MIRRSVHLILVALSLSTIGCVKETYDMKKLSEKAHLSPTIAISAIKGYISLSDIAKSGDTLVFDGNNFVKIIYRVDSVIDLSLQDFSCAKKTADLTNNITPELPYLSRSTDYPTENLGQLTASIEQYSLDLGIDDILSHLSGDVHITDPIIRLKYLNPFVDPIVVTFIVTGKNKDRTVELGLAPFALNHPANLSAPEVSDTFTVDKSNSELPELISMLPSMIDFSGTAVMSVPTLKSGNVDYLTGNEHLIGNIEVEVPLEFRMNNLQFSDTVDNFLKDNSGNNDNPFNPEDFQMLRVDISAKNGFPLGVSVKMSLYDSLTHSIRSTVDATRILEAAPVDSNGKVEETKITESSTSIEFTKDFFSAISKSDKIIFWFTLITTESGSKDIKIYSDYHIDFHSALVMKPVINLK